MNPDEKRNILGLCLSGYHCSESSVSDWLVEGGDTVPVSVCLLSTNKDLDWIKAEKGGRCHRRGRKREAFVHSILSSYIFATHWERGHMRGRMRLGFVQNILSCSIFATHSGRCHGRGRMRLTFVQSVRRTKAPLSPHACTHHRHMHARTRTRTHILGTTAVHDGARVRKLCYHLCECVLCVCVCVCVCLSVSVSVSVSVCLSVCRDR